MNTVFSIWMCLNIFALIGLWINTLNMPEYAFDGGISSMIFEKCEEQNMKKIGAIIPCVLIHLVIWPSYITYCVVYWLVVSIILLARLYAKAFQKKS